MTKCKLCERDSPEKNKEFKRLNQHLLGKYHKTTMYKYKTLFNEKIEPVDILMDKFQCTSYLQLAGLLGASRGGAINSLQKGTGRKILHVSYKIIAILLKRMPEPELKKSLREIRFLRDNE